MASSHILRRSALAYTVLGGSIFATYSLINRSHQTPASFNLNVAHNEGINSADDNSSKIEKLSIYDGPSMETKVIEIPPGILEASIRESRHAIRQNLQSVKNSLQTVVDRWIEVEKSVNSVVSKVKAPEERLIPSVLYVVVSGFAGSILVKNRSIISRFFVPPIFTVASAMYFIPKTTTNIYHAVTAQLPQETQQEIANVQLKAVEIAEDMKLRVEETVRKAKEMGSGMTNGRKQDSKDVAPIKSVYDDQPKMTTSEVVEKLENMYTTRGKPGIRDVIEEDRDGPKSIEGKEEKTKVEAEKRKEVGKN
ncbi:apolipo protein O-domain-containing protein [Paraphysoderma sedebokerense]|nr:apolipo protein O-domain-containing protein [Paraphysoderma sedebokerense]